jgi:hypothetical protein
MAGESCAGGNIGHGNGTMACVGLGCSCYLSAALVSHHHHHEDTPDRSQVALPKH